MSNELVASFIVFWKLLSHEFLKFVVVLKVHAVPIFGSAFMQIVDTIKIEVLFMPSEHRLPRSNVYVWISNTLDLNVAKSFIQNSLNLC